MYTQGSVEFNELIETPNNQALVKRLILTDDNTEIENIISIVMHSSSSQDELQIGTTNMSYIEVVAVTDKVLTNREVRLECGVKLSNGTIEYAPMGVFTIQKPKGDLDRITFTANDKMQKFEKPYTSSLTYPTTSNKVLAELCNMCGVELATPIDTPITIATKLDGYTCREMLGYISGIHAKFACFDRLGKLNLRWYSNTPIEKKIGLIYKFSKAERNFTVDKVEVAKDSETKYTSGDGLGVIYYSNPLATQDITNKIFNNIDGFAYNASTIEILDDIRLDLGDVIKVTYLDGIDYLVPCMSLKQDFAQGSTSIEAYSKTDEENEYRYTGPTTKYIERVAHELLLANRIIATKVDADYVQSHAITTDNLDAIQANITTLVVEEIDGRYANLDFANIDVANINVAKMGELFAKVGLIDRATIKDGHITGFLDAVEINANKITAGTLIADRILLNGGNKGVLYALNNLGELTSTNVNSLDGYVLTDRTITADKIIAKSITTNELDVNQIFGNTAVLNTIVSQDIFANAVSTNTLLVGAVNKAEEALNTINGLEIGGTNLLPDTNVNTLNAVAGSQSRYWSDSSMASYVSCEFIELTDSPINGLKYGVRQTSLGTSGGNNGRNLTWRGSEKIELIDGAEYTLSCYARITDGTQARLRFRFYNSGNQTYNINITNTEWKRITKTIKVNKTTWGADYCNIGCGGLCDTYAATVELCGFKLEKGNRATDWTPAPEDVELNVETANTNANTAISNANNAISTANTANSNANTAITTANTANTNATTANTNALNAIDTANTANATANTASTNATNALNRATYHYGTCSTAAGTAAKVVSLSGFVLYTGAQVTVQFSKANTAANPTLNVNSTGAKNIRVNNANITSKYYWSANNTVTFVYNGTYWVMSDTSANTIIANWCSSNDVTYIDGGKIYTGSITADKINVIDLFSQSIIATGSITGATLYGAYAEINEGNIGDWHINDGSMASITDDIITRATGAFEYDLTNVVSTGLYGMATYVTNGKEKVTLSASGDNVYLEFASVDDKERNKMAYQINMYGIEKTIWSSDFTTSETKVILGYLDNGIYTPNLSADRSDILSLYAQKMYFSSAEGRSIIISNTSTALANGVVQNMLGVKYKDAGNQVFTTYPIRVIGSTQTSNYNAGVLLGSNNGTTILASGESSSTMPAKISAYNNEHLYLTSDGTIRMYTGCANDASSYTEALIIANNGSATFKNTVTAPTFSGALNGTASNASQLGGKTLLAKNSTDTWEGIPYVDDKGVMEIGRYIDFHSTDGNTADYDVRITATTDGLNISGTTSGIFSGTVYANNIIMPNNSAILFKNSSGTEINSLYMGPNNVLYLGFDAEKIIIGKALQGTNFNCGIEFVYSSNDTKLNIIPANVSNYATYLGDATYYYNTIYYQTLSQISDRNSKKDIFDISEKYLDLWDKLSVKTFRYIDDDKTVKVGLIAQEVEKCALKSGLSLEQCGFILREYVDNEIYKGYKYSLDYTGLATITMAKLKQVIGNITEHDKRIQKLEDEIAILKATINQMQMQYA